MAEEAQLPDLGSQPQTQTSNLFDPSLIDLIKRKKLVGQAGLLDYEVGLKNAQFNLPINQYLIHGLLGYNGNKSLNISGPLLGGQLNFSAQQQDGSPNYSLGYQRSF